MKQTEEYLATVKEAAKIYHIGEHRLRAMSKERDCDFALYVGNRLLIKRKQFEEYLDRTTYI